MKIKIFRRTIQLTALIIAAIYKELHDCRVCHTSCPQYNKAIWLEKNKYPTVNADYCTGCGMCEHVCIASPKAIHVKPRGGAE